MPEPDTPFDWASVAVAACPPSHRLPGISMAGFSQVASTPPVEIAMIPHPSITVLIDLSEGGGVLYDVHGRRTYGSVVVGLHPRDLRASGRSVDCLQIRLPPSAAAAVLGAAAELTGALVPLEDLWGHEAEQAEAKLRAATSWNERFAIATDLLGRRLEAGRPVEPEVAHSWRRMRSSRGRVRVEHLADEIGWSRTRLWSRFRTQLGISPKRAARLVRFDRAAHLLAAGGAAADVAIESGYVDQSHLHHEVQAFTGLTPSGVAAAPWLAIDDVAWPASPWTRARDDARHVDARHRANRAQG